MPLILRKITKSKWMRSERPAWLSPDDMPADTFVDLRTSGNKLSVWEVADNRSNLERVLVALATANDKPSNVDYAMIDIKALETIGIRSERTPGKCPDGYAAQHWHIDLIELSVDRLRDLAKLLYSEQTTISRMLEKDVLRHAAAAVQDSRVSASELSDDWRKKLKLTPPPSPAEVPPPLP